MDVIAPSRIESEKASTLYRTSPLSCAGQIPTQLSLEDQTPERFAKAIQTANLIPTIKHPAAKNLLIRRFLGELKDAIGGPKRVA